MIEILLGLVKELKENQKRVERKITSVRITYENSYENSIESEYLNSLESSLDMRGESPFYENHASLEVTNEIVQNFIL